MLKIFDKKEPTLGRAQKLVGGYVECLTVGGGDRLIFNEEGKILNLPINKEATKLFTDEFGKVDVICGDAILIKKAIRKNW
jgi:hypothetical protein|tara:strand:- start:443 stop:685 length:243 start_codon:yes stop_codon:yes gene_type:complete